jgi:hypothetical protein
VLGWERLAHVVLIGSESMILDCRLRICGVWAKWLRNRRHANCGASIGFKRVTEFLHGTHKNYIQKACLGCLSLEGDRADASGLLKSNAELTSLIKSRRSSHFRSSRSAIFILQRTNTPQGVLSKRLEMLWSPVRFHVSSTCSGW